MSSVGTIRLAWQGGEHDFCCATVGNILSLQDLCGAGIGTILQRLIGGAWYVQDIRETIRLGLIGGGLAPDRALELVKVHVDSNERGLAPSVVLAIKILERVVIGVPDDPLGKAAAAGAEMGLDSSMTMAASAAQPSSGSAPA